MRISKLIITATLGLLLALTLLPQVVMSEDIPVQSTSTSVNVESVRSLAPAAEGDAADIITFSEFPRGTHVSNQYANRGIVFGGDNPFITSDGANPTSPVLSGTPLFQGAIEGKFVNPSDGTTPTIVRAFTLDAGYFDGIGTTRIEWFDPDGKKLGQRTNTRYGIERFVIEGGNIARWRIAVIAYEPAGYAIDNVSFEAARSSVLFREKSEPDGYIGPLPVQIPSWDHSGLNVDNLVYESHPPYEAGTYYSEDGTETVEMHEDDGVQAQFTVATFAHDARLPGAENSTVTNFEQIPIEEGLAERMRDQINMKLDAGFQYFSLDPVGFLLTLTPSAQKGRDGRFTCVGLVEWAAEQAGHNNGQGFIRDVFEEVPIPTPPFVRFPLLSPGLLNYAMKFSLTLKDVQQWLQGIFDPVDFMITDPLGRKLGYTAELGEKNEIPRAFYSGDGDLEQFLIPNPVAGTYQIELIGLDRQVLGAYGSSSNAAEVDMFLAQGQKDQRTFTVDLVPGAPGDVNRDGVIDDRDVQALMAVLNSFTNDPNDPGDIDGDGIRGQSDLVLLNQLLALSLEQPPALTVPDNQSVQYSDALSFDISAFDPDDPADSLIFSASGLPSGLTLTDRGDGTATVAGTIEAGPAIYTAQITVTDPDGLTDTKTVSIVVNPEDARATYAGAVYVSTASASSSAAIVTLAATMQDISVTTDAAGDTYPGDVRNATITFVNRDTNSPIAGCMDLPVGLTNPGDLQTGTATCNWNVTINGDAQDFTVGIVVGNYYTRNASTDNVVVMVAKPLTSNFISGGGHIVLSNSAGLKAGDTGSKNNFGFNVKYNKKGTNLQGRINVIVRRTEPDGLHVYQIKGSAMTSLAVQLGPGTATFNGKASIQDITNPLAPIPIDGNATLQVAMDDNGEPGSSDTISITVWNKSGGLWFASKWNGVKTIQQLLNGGNLVVH